jgi:hypothetical protein
MSEQDTLYRNSMDAFVQATHEGIRREKIAGLEKRIAELEATAVVLHRRLGKQAINIKTFMDRNAQFKAVMAQLCRANQLNEGGLIPYTLWREAEKLVPNYHRHDFQTQQPEKEQG